MLSCNHEPVNVPKGYDYIPAPASTEYFLTEDGDEITNVCPTIMFHEKDGVMDLIYVVNYMANGAPKTMPYFSVTTRPSEVCVAKGITLSNWDLYRQCECKGRKRYCFNTARSKMLEALRHKFKIF